jgi:hypothetical protein
MTHPTLRRAPLRLAVTALVLGATAAACSGSSEPDGPPPPLPSLPAACYGAYECDEFGAAGVPISAHGTLAVEGGTCKFKGGPAGGTTLDLSDPHVVIDGRSFHDPSEGVDIWCAPEEPAAQSGSRCSGSADSCSSMGTRCSAQDGCLYRIHDTTTASDDRCEGSADACDSYDSQANCEHQQGCSWR